MSFSSEATDWRVIQVHYGAPPKPLEGAPCNGCGLCCLWQPCPLGMVLSRRRQGACAALLWDAAEQRYLCGMLSDPGGVTGWRHPWAVGTIVALARRWIAADAGCDAPLQAQPLEGPLPNGAAEKYPQDG